MPMSYREAVKLIKNHGGELFRHGGSHNLFIMPWGAKIAVPRHPGDLSPGVERNIRKKVTGTNR